MLCSAKQVLLRRIWVLTGACTRWGAPIRQTVTVTGTGTGATNLGQVYTITLEPVDFHWNVVPVRASHRRPPHCDRILEATAIAR